ncbi:hypothetical protein H1S01_11705 [Heliobacterium chlorum]|uniref:Uncharacterized protein n=1 Tax=Heliobacterium chlorum TaxID=2698 RepID=A0ABR7T328_HELCL|nr:hypothetical protein [Heliobacterium chlorum]MBC9785174.1 hypothetical protein [Heliobacterium chlorum]
MSAFLGPIHYWLYQKIRKVVEREQLIYEKASSLCGDAATNLRNQLWERYGEPLPDVDLSQLIEGENIHGWLQSQITLAETREAALIKGLIDLCGDGGRDLVEQAFAEHGAECGRNAREQGESAEGASHIYKALNNFLLNGMPCDQADMITVNTEEKVVWESALCLQEANWHRAGVDAPTMKRLYQRWISGFVQALNPDFAYRQTGDTTQGDPVNRHEIIRK